MIKKVLKFGGTSVGTVDRIQHVAKIIKRECDVGNKIIVVVSAMAGQTNDLIKLSQSVANDFSKRELDVLLSTGEQVTCALLAGALTKINIKAKSWLNWQIPILTEGEHANSRIVNMNVSKINNYINKGVAVVPGFQRFLKMVTLPQLVVVDLMLQQLLSQNYLMQIHVKSTLMLMVFFTLTQIKYLLLKK